MTDAPAHVWIVAPGPTSGTCKNCGAGSSDDATRVGACVKIRRPRRDITAELRRCPIPDRHGSPCGTLVWNKPEELRGHLRDHLGAGVDFLDDAGVVHYYRDPTETL